MRLFGFEITRQKATLSAVSESRGGWFPLIREPFAGAWQRNREWRAETVLAHPTVFACVNLIASDIAKMRTKLVEEVETDLWREITSPAFSPVLRKPNAYQNQVQFKKNWITSKLVSGNAYILKERDVRGVVVGLYVLDPNRVTVLVSEDGAVFYQLQADNLSGRQEPVVVPAREIIHDRMNCLFHPLIGVSPLYACGASANMGLEIEGNSTAFFGNGSTPSGILSSPETISPDKSRQLLEAWEGRFGRGKPGGIAVLGFGMKFEPMRQTAAESQLTELLKWTGDSVCSAYRVPAFMVNAGPVPAFQNAELLIRLYFSTCLQEQAVDFETAMDEGLNMIDETKGGKRLGVELDKDALLQMDQATQIDTLVKGVRGGVYTPNGARRKIDEPPLEGGNTIYLQHQDYPIEQVFNRTDLTAPKLAPAPAPAPQPDPTPAGGDKEMDAEERDALVALFRKAIAA